jgi:hypothetical protein
VKIGNDKRASVRARSQCHQVWPPVAHHLWGLRSRGVNDQQGALIRCDNRLSSEGDDEARVEPGRDPLPHDCPQKRVVESAVAATSRCRALVPLA